MCSKQNHEDVIVDLFCLPYAYQNADMKKPLRISAPKWLFYLVGPPRLELGTNGL